MSNENTFTTEQSEALNFWINNAEKIKSVLKHFPSLVSVENNEVEYLSKEDYFDAYKGYKQSIESHLNELKEYAIEIPTFKYKIAE